MALKLLVFILPVVVAVLLIALQPTDESLAGRPLKIVENNQLVEENLERYREQLGADYTPYRNHILRVLTWSLHFLGELGDKYLTEISIALVYHDLGLWTDRSTLAYIEPSIEVASKDLKGSKFDAKQLELVELIIDNHHKLTAYESGDSERDQVVNAVRKADLIDLSSGLVRKGMPRKYVQDVLERIPVQGFHSTLLAFTFHDWNIPRSVYQLLHIYRF